MSAWTALSPSAALRAGALAASLCLTVLPVPSAQAAGGTCTIITYYRDKAMTQNVGLWSNCPGSKGLRGRRTRYFERETQPINPGPGTPDGPGGLPCEFLQSGCGPFGRP